MGAVVRLEPAAGGRACILPVRAQPGARRTAVVGVWNGMLKVAVASPPEKGRANHDLAQVLAKSFGLRSSAIRLVSGERSRQKRFHLEASLAFVSTKLAEILASHA